jgi:hypothetical protein
VSLSAIAGLSAGLTGLNTAQAVIIYQDIPDVMLHVPTLGSTVTAGIDFLDDGSNEFTLSLSRVPIGGSNEEISFGISGSTPQIRVLSFGSGIEANWAVRFEAGQLIQSGGTANPSLMYSRQTGGGPSFGLWLDSPGTHFVGLVINGFAGPNYGWARITTTFDSAIPEQYLILHDFAFEGQPHVPINAGDIPAPGALGLMGVAGLLAARRKR